MVETALYPLIRNVATFSWVSDVENCAEILVDQVQRAGRRLLGLSTRLTRREQLSRRRTVAARDVAHQTAVAETPRDNR